MKANQLILFLIPVFIWGSTWFVITFQLGETNPLFSVGYRFAIAGIILLIYCLLFKVPIRYSLPDHLTMVLQGFLLFGFNYFFVYISEQYLTSGIVAAGFSLVIFLNAIFGAIFLKVPLNPVVIISGFIGVSGVLLIFKDDIEALSLSSDSFRGMIYCILSVVFASLGNITSAYNQRKKLPVIQTNMYGMLYGAIILILTAFVSGGKISFDTSIPYIGSLLYLAIFGSVLAFGTYLKLIGEIGPDKAAFVLSVVPLIALIISSVFEDLEWTIFTISGTIMIIIANYITLAKRTKLKYSTK